MPAVRIIQEGHVLVMGGPAAGCTVPQLSGCRVGQHSTELQTGERQVMVGAGVGARPAAVLKQDSLVWVVA